MRTLSALRLVAAFGFALLVSSVSVASASAASADLSVALKATPAIVLKGDAVTYTVSVTNLGPDAALSFTVTDALPAGFTFVSGSTGCTVAAGTVTCTSGKLYAASVRTFSLKFSTASATCGATLTNTVSVSSATDPNPANDTSNTVSTVVSCPDFSISIAAPVAKILKGDLLSYYISVKNNGTVAQSFVMTDAVPSGLTFVSGTTGCTAAAGVVTCTSSKISAGTTRTFLLKFSTASATCAATVTNTASVSSATDPNPANDTSAAVSTVVSCPDFSISIATPVATILKGDLLSNYISVKNNGTVAQSFVMTDIVPSGLSFSSGTTGCTAAGDTVTCTSGKLAAGATRTFLLKFSTASVTCAAAVTNTASVSAAMDPNSANDVSNTVSTTVICPEADVTVVKSGSSSILKGTSLKYVIKATNAGPTTVTNVVVKDAIPSGLVFQSGVGCTVALSTVTCNVGTLTSGKSKTFTLFFGTAAATCNADVVNTATVTFKGAIDPNTSNNTSSVTTNMTCPVTENELTVVVKSTATSDIAVSNQKDINLLRFEARADNENLLATRFIFQGVNGLSLTNGTNYALWVDTDNDGVVDSIVQNGVSAAGGAVTFDTLSGGGFVLPATETRVFEVHTDVASATLTGTALQLKFATTFTGYVSAERQSDGSDLAGIKTDGVCATTCETTVLTNSSTLWTLRSQGDLWITKSSTPVRSRQLLGGTLTDEVLRLQLRAEYEGVDVTNLVFTADGADAAALSSNVDRIELYKTGETTPFATASVAGCGTDPVPAYSMCASMQAQQLTVAKGTLVNVLVRTRMRTDTDGAVSGKHVKLTVDAVAGAKARGLISSNNLLTNDGDAISEGEVFIGTSAIAPSQTITGNDNVVVLSKVLSITNASPDANGTAIPTGTQRQIGQFKFSSAAHANLKNGSNKWALSDIIFNVNVTNVLTNSGSYKIYNKADASTKAPCTVSYVNASSLLAICSGLLFSSVNTEIDQGYDTTFVLEADVINAKVNNAQASTLQVSLQNFDSIAATSFGAAASHLQWVDKDFGASANFLWIEYPESTVNGTSYNG